MSRPEFKHWFGFDTENDEKGVVTLTALAGEHGDVDVFSKAGCIGKQIEDGEFEDGSVIVCHNLEYDLRNEFGDFFPYLSLTYLKGRLITAGFKNVRFLDSFNHYRCSLSVIGKAFGLEKKAYDINSSEYVSVDAMIPVKAMTFTRDYLKTLEGRIGSTAGSSAMSVWLAMTGDDFLTGPNDDPWLRSGYAGGRVELFRDHAEGNVRGYDVNSMYPASMLDKFPMVTNEDPKMDKQKGMAEILVSVPSDMFVSPFFYRGKDGRMTYPVGVFRGTWTYDEIREAQSLGCKILKVYKAIGGNYCERPFDEFVNTIYGKRMASTNPAEREVLKCILNSLYGKMAAGRSITRVVSKHTLLEQGSKRINDVTWIDHNRGLLEYFPPSPRYVNVLWGAMITANARIRLGRLLRSVPPEKLIYCDTDSVYTVDHEMPLSPGLGGLKLEHDGKHVMRVVQPKVYQLDDFYKAKGIPKPKKDEDGNVVVDFAKSYIEDGFAEFEAPVRFRESLKKIGVRHNEWTHRRKERRSSYDAKTLSGHRYFPPVIGDQMEFVLQPGPSKKVKTA
jgi:hypothetical protein